MMTITILSAISFLAGSLILEVVHPGGVSAFMSGGLTGMAIWAASGGFG